MIGKHSIGAQIDEPMTAGRRACGLGRRCLAILFTLALARSAAAAAPPGGAGSIEAPPRPRLYQDRVYVRARPRDATDVDRIWNLAEDVVSPHDPALVEHELVLTPDTLARLRAAGVPAQIVERDVQRWIDDGIERARRPATSPGFAKASAFGPWFSKVQTLDAITTYLHDLEQASGGRATLQVIGKSIEQRDLLALRISSAPRGASRPSVIVLGTQHAREWASPMVTMGVADALVRQYDDDPRIRRVVDNLEILVVPVVNPDGYVATFNGKRLQRKNMDPTCNVDLNRNYDTAFGKGTGGNCQSETYPGPAAFSEPETQAVRDLIATLPRPRLLVDYHSTAAVIMIPFAYTQSPPPQLAENKLLCQLYSSTLGAVNGTHYPAVPGYSIAAGAGGGAFDWFRTRYGHTIVVELGSGGGAAGFDLPASSVVPFVEENLAGWLAVAEKIIDSEAGDAGASEPADAAADASSGPDQAIDAALVLPPDARPVSSERADAAPDLPVTPPDDQLRRKVHADQGCAYAPQAPGSSLIVVAALAALALRRRSARGGQR
jgi:hypothetical protein